MITIEIIYYALISAILNTCMKGPKNRFLLKLVNKKYPKKMLTLWGKIE